MPDSAVIYPLAMLTLIALIVFAFWQLYRVDDAKKHHDHSALANHNEPDDRHDSPSRPRSRFN